MERLSLKKILWAFLKQQHTVLLSVFFSLSLFILIFSVYSLEFEAILYATLLTSTVLILVGCIRFNTFYKKHRTLESLSHTLTTTYVTLPEASDLIEADYQCLLVLLHDQFTQMTSHSDAFKTDLLDYYTLWAHQIKTPIAAMRLLLQTQSPKESAAYIDALSLELFKVEQYVEMVLQYARLEGISSDLVLASYDLATLCKQAVRKYAKMFILQNITLDFNVPSCTVLTDEKWLVFVLEQLLSNALKYTPHGKITLSLDPTQPQTLCIQDTGIGIQSEDLPRIFEKGFTGFNGRMDKKSTGIGLYLSQTILKKLGHKLTITSTVGEGTTVHLDLSSYTGFME